MAAPAASPTSTGSRQSMDRFSIDSDGPDTLIHARLTSILKFVKKHNLRKYTIFGFKNGEWQVMIKY